MTTKQQLRKLLNGYVIDRNTLEEIHVPARATRGQMESLASSHGLSVRECGGHVTLEDERYTYAVRDGNIITIAG